MKSYNIEVATIDSSFANTGDKIRRYSFVAEADNDEIAKERALAEHRKVDRSGRSIDSVEILAINE